MATSSFQELKTIRIDHTGALRAPSHLRDAATKNRWGKMPDDELAALRESVIEELIRKQEAIGLPVVTDGELRRNGFQDSFNGAVEGFEAEFKKQAAHENLSLQPFVRTQSASHNRWRVLSKLKLVKNLILEEYRLGSKVATRPVKVTLIGPERIIDRFDAASSRDVYDGVEEFIADVVAIEREMIRQVVAAGCRYVQIDEPGYTGYVDEISIAELKARGEDPDKIMERAIKADNDIIAGFDDVVFGLHICRGGARTIDPKTKKLVPQWHREGHYDAIAERLFGGLNHDRILLEYDSERAGSFEPLRFFPPGKVAVLGLVTTKSNDVESADTLKRRIEEASDHIPLEQLALSPQCGFGAMREAAPEEDVQWRKFEVIVETARSVWG
jgi:5-methyltetrahydropteroyltriglutamate--homocysteine methyltransferase